MFSGGDRAIGSWSKISAALIFLFVFISSMSAASVSPHLFSDHMVFDASCGGAWAEHKAKALGPGDCRGEIG